MNTDNIAGIYDILGKLIFGDQLEKAYSFYLGRIIPHDKILIIGGGTGKILQKLDELEIPLEIDYIEISQAMLERSRKRVLQNIKVRFVRADVTEWQPESDYNILITPFVLDCFSDHDLNSLMSKLSTKLHKDGIWIFTDFVRTQFFWQKSLVKIMYWFFRVTTGLTISSLPDFKKAFENANLDLSASKTFYHNMIEARVYSVSV
jgi:ubiquinone/menaquinone biosynthesis C-methylase UbiE